MKFYLFMPELLSEYFDNELLDADVAFKLKYYQQSWRHLERAHILGQPYPFAHTLVHWKMLNFGIRTKNIQEILGQIPRLLAGGIKSFVGKIPVGNTGGANVPPLKPMEIPEDLIQIIKSIK
jgi:hypothetical protein